MKILVVDDEPVIRDVLVAMLEDEGYTVVAADRGARALELFALEKPDLIVLDIMLPDIDGREVCRRIHATPGACQIPVIMLSAAVRPRLEECRLAAFLPKPFEVDHLLAEIARTAER